MTVIAQPGLSSRCAQCCSSYTWASSLMPFNDKLQVELDYYGASTHVPMMGAFERLKTICILKQRFLRGHSLHVSTATSNLLFSGGIWSLDVSSQNSGIFQTDLRWQKAGRVQT